MITLLASLSVLSSGMGLGFPAITSQVLLKYEDLTTSQVSWFASVTAITCPLGGPLAGFLTEKYGRRNTLMISSVIAIISWILIGFSSHVNVELLFIQLMIGRAVIGLNIGMTTAPTVMYASEVCHQRIRGRMTMLSSPFFTALGLLTIYFLGYMIPVRFVAKKSFLKS
jgi:MFS family permease